MTSLKILCPFFCFCSSFLLKLLLTQHKSKLHYLQFNTIQHTDLIQHICIPEKNFLKYFPLEVVLDYFHHFFLPFFFFPIFKKFWLEANYFTLLWVCHRLTWVSRGNTRVPRLEPPPTSLPGHPSGLSQSSSLQCPALCIELALVVCFTRGNIHVSVLFSQTVPPLPSPTLSESLFFTSVSLLLSCI